jgi:ribosome biogenesis GTPase A
LDYRVGVFYFNKQKGQCMASSAKSSLISGYMRLKGDLSECIKDMLAIGNIRRSPCEELRDKILTDTFNLVVVGQFKRGKTSLINALLGNAILPVSVAPLTSIVTIITYGEALRVSVHFNYGGTAEISSENIHEYVTEKGNPKNAKDVREVVLTYFSSYLRDGVRLIDTPGALRRMSGLRNLLKTPANVSSLRSTRPSTCS